MKLAVLFPGVGYTCKRPLLYYTGTAAEDKGYTLIRLDYGEDIHTFRGRGMEDLKPLSDLAVERAVKALKKTDFSAYEDIVMISKSVGTVIAVRTAEKLKIKARHFMITPIPMTEPYMKTADCIFLSGTGDPYISREQVLALKKSYPEKVGRIFKNCNHSLEQKGDTPGNLKNLKKTVELLTDFLKS